MKRNRFSSPVGLFLCIIIWTIPTHSNAQFKQHGVTLEYNRKHAKSIYSKPVELRFEGASSTLNKTEGEYGPFVLQFDKAHAGDTIKGFSIVIGDKDYIVFNRDKINDWNLSPQAPLEIVVCKKSLIEWLKNTYINNRMAQLENKIKRLKIELSKSNKEADEYRKRLQEIEDKYYYEANIIKAQAVQFAYVDETQLDSLELLRREYVLKNDIVSAVEIGEKMDLVTSSISAIHNYNISQKAHEHWKDKLVKLSTIIEDHILNCMSSSNYEDEFEFEHELSSYRVTLIDIYRLLLKEYSDSKSKTDSYLRVKKRLGVLLCREAEFSEDSIRDSLYLEAAQLNNPSAYYYNSKYSNKTKYEEKKKYSKNLLDMLENSITGEMDGINIDEVREYYESFPDFGMETEYGIMYYHILNENEVCLSFYQQLDTLIKRIVVPSTVYYNGKIYTVTKIGRNTFRDGTWIYHGTLSWWDNAMFQTDSSFCDNYSIIINANRESLYPSFPEWTNEPQFAEIDSFSRLVPIINEVVLPNTIYSVGQGSFCGLKELYVNIPEKVKKIKEDTFRSLFWTTGIIDIPEGVEEFDGFSGLFSNEYEYDVGYSLYLPSTLQKLDNFECVWRDSPTICSINLNPCNDYFLIINNLLYSADSSCIYFATAYNDDDKILFIPKQYTSDLDSVIEYAYFPSQLWSGYDSVYVEADNPVYASYHGVLYDKELKVIKFLPLGIEKVVLPDSFVNIESGCGYINNIVIPKDMKDELVLQLLNKAVEESIIVNYYDVERPISSKEELLLFVDEIIMNNPNEAHLYELKKIISIGTTISK